MKLRSEWLAYSHLAFGQLSALIEKKQKRDIYRKNLEKVRKIFKKKLLSQNNSLCQINA